MDTLSSSLKAQTPVNGEGASFVAPMQQLNTRRNELAPVSKLPEEILQHIFIILRDSYTGNYYDWLLVTQVCSYWRYVAIAFPSLWTRVYDPTHTICRLMLERSRSAPLDVRLAELLIPEDTSTLTIIFCEIKRIKLLIIYNMSPDFLDAVRNILAALNQEWEASTLESLEVDIRIDGPFSALVQLSADLFRPSHRLRRLLLSGGYDSWGVLPLPGLTHLNLYGQCIGEVAGPQLIESLRDMHSLKSLVIGWQLQQFSLSPPPRPVILPRLQKLEIAGHQHILDSFMPLATSPKLRQLTVKAYNPTVDLVPFIKSVLPSIKKANFGSLEYLKILNCQDIIIAASPETQVWGLLNDDDDATSSFIHMFTRDAREGLSLNHNGTPFNIVMDVMSCITPLNYANTIGLRHISLDSEDATIDEFTRSFVHLSHLEAIEIKFKLSPVLFKILESTSTTQDVVSNTPVLFQNLQSITCRSHYYYTHDSTGPFFSSTVFDDLHRVLLARRARGVPITKLRLIACPLLKETQANQLAKIGVEVKVE